MSGVLTFKFSHWILNIISYDRILSRLFPLGMLISFFSKNRLSFWKNRFFFRLSNFVSLSRYAGVTCRTPRGRQ